MSNNNKRKNIIGRFAGDLIAIAETMLISFFVMTLVFTYLLKVATVSGSSMETTLMPNDKIVALSLYPKPSNGDIVIINAEEAVMLDENGEPASKAGLGKQIVKRVIATEGQKVNIDFQSGTVYVDDKMLNEDYITGLTHLDEGAFTGRYPIIIPDGYIFVLGDNRAVSKDSRSIEVGLISEDSVEGKVFFRLSPKETFGFVN